MIVETWCIQRLALIKIDNLSKLQYRLHRVQTELAEYRMELMQAHVRHVNLHLLLPLSALIIMVKFLLYLEETTFYFFFDFRFQLFLDVVSLQILALETL